MLELLLSSSFSLFAGSLGRSVGLPRPLSSSLRSSSSLFCSPSSLARLFTHSLPTPLLTPPSEDRARTLTLTPSSRTVEWTTEEEEEGP